MIGGLDALTPRLTWAMMVSYQREGAIQASASFLLRYKLEFNAIEYHMDSCGDIHRLESRINLKGRVRLTMDTSV